TAPTYMLGSSLTALANAQPDSRTETGLSAYTDYTVTVLATRDGIAVQTRRSIKTLCAHVWNEGTVTLAPTCTEGGVKEVTCTVCGENSTAEIAALGHDFAVEYTVDVAATCTAAGEKSQHCSRCTAKRNVTGIPATGHRYGEGVETTAPTYTAAGVMTYTCTVCGATRTESIPMLESAQYYEALTEGAVYTAIETRADGGDFAIRSFTKYGVPAGTAVFELPEELADKETYYVYRLVGDFMLLTDYTVSEDGLIIDAADGDVYAVSDAPLVFYGDVNADGGMTLADVLRTMRCLAGEDVSADLAAADYNGSASLTLLDALAILLAVLNG
ncbi:MAG: hypothetical protein IJU41_09400, partial [Clostridia bacterium]|nr:hypothetical protein [Clostridia bacterium]